MNILIYLYSTLNSGFPVVISNNITFSSCENFIFDVDGPYFIICCDNVVQVRQSFSPNNIIATYTLNYITEKVSIFGNTALFLDY